MQPNVLSTLKCQQNFGNDFFHTRSFATSSTCVEQQEYGIHLVGTQNKQGFPAREGQPLWKSVSFSWKIHILPTSDRKEFLRNFEKFQKKFGDLPVMPHSGWTVFFMFTHLYQRYGALEWLPMFSLKSTYVEGAPNFEGPAIINAHSANSFVFQNVWDRSQRALGFLRRWSARGGAYGVPPPWSSCAQYGFQIGICDINVEFEA